MIESKVYDDTIYNWNFKDDASVVSNERVKATKFGNPTFSGGVATFTNSDSYRLISTINLGVKFTISVKVKFTTSSGWGTGVSILGNLISGDYGVSVHQNQPLFQMSVANNVVYCTWVKDTDWHEFTITRNGATVKMYIDGVEKTVTGTILATASMILGAISGKTDGIGSRIEGSLEYIRIWNRPLTVSEVTNTYYGRSFKALPYSANEVLGSELLPNNDFRVGYVYNNVTAVSATDFTINVSNGYLAKIITTIGRTYKITIVGTIAGTIINFRVIGNAVYRDGFTGVINTTFYFTADSTDLHFRALGTGLISIIVSLSEVKSSSLNTLFHINSYRGVIRDMVNKVTPVATNVSLKAIGSGIKVMQFGTTTGSINIGTVGFTGDRTFMFWINRNTLGEGNIGSILRSAGVMIRNSISNTIGIILVRDTIAVNSAPINKFANWYFVAITSTATGITNFYVGDTKNAPVLSGTANQAAGTPVTGGTTYLGNNFTDSATLDGAIGEIRVDAAILTLAEITQFLSDTKSLYY